MRAEQYRERQVEIEGWPVRLTSYKLGNFFHCTADNVSPGACLARTTGETRQESEEKALTKAHKRLSRAQQR